MMQVADGTVVTLEYTVILADGTLLDSTRDCGPLAVMIGSAQLFPGLEDRILGMAPGETRTITIPAEDAYGERRPELVRTMPRERLPPELDLEVGREYRLKSPDGRALRFRLLEIGETQVKADFNRPQAGQELHATITIVGVRAPTAEEERRGRA
jgi:peptidylprolyl isomerase